MIQMVILGLAVICVLAAIKTFITGSIQITKGSPVQGSAARNIGIGLIILAVVMAVFALAILPRLGK